MMSRAARILVVDDEPTICRALAIILSREGYEVTALESAERAETVLRTEHVDCLVLDLRMAEMRGDILFNIAASVQPHLAHATIFTTGDTGEVAMELIESCGCPYLLKPFDLADLKKAVGAMTAHRGEASA